MGGEGYEIFLCLPSLPCDVTERRRPFRALCHGGTAEFALVGAIHVATAITVHQTNRVFLIGARAVVVRTMMMRMMAMRAMTMV